MKTLAALVWKEWMQARWFLLGGLAVFVFVPLIPLLTTGISSDILEMFVLVFGWVFAIFTAAGLFCCDLEDRLSAFWQSRPMSLWKWTLVKYCTGLICVFAVCFLPVIVIMILRMFWPPQWETETSWALLSYLSYTLILIYSLAMLISCLVRQTTHAAILSVAAGLLVFGLPLLLPSLEPVSVLNMLTRAHPPRFQLVSDGAEQIGQALVGMGQEQWAYYYGSPHWLWLHLPGSKVLVFQYFPGYWTFVAIMLALSLAAVLLAILSLKLHWKIRMDQKLLFWALGFTALLLFTCGAFAIGSNMEPQETIELPLFSKGLLKSTLLGNQGILITGCYPDNDRSFDSFDLPIIRFRYEGDYQEEVFNWPKQGLKLNTRLVEDMIWSPNTPDTLWLLIVDISKTESGHHRKLNLLTLRLDPDTKKAQQTGDQFLAEYTSPDNSWPAGGRCVLAQDRLYIPVYGNLMVLDVSQPQSPVVVQTIDPWHPQWMQSGSSRGVELRHRPVPAEGLSLIEQTAVAAKMNSGMDVSEDLRHAAEVTRDFIRVYRVEESNDGLSTWQSFGQRRPTPLERLIDAHPTRSLYNDNLLYIIMPNNMMEGGSLAVYRVEEDGTIRRIRHFARPHEFFENVSVLDDGRILLVGQTKIYILPSPAR